MWHLEDIWTLIVIKGITCDKNIPRLMSVSLKLFYLLYCLFYSQSPPCAWKSFRYDVKITFIFWIEDFLGIFKNFWDDFFFAYENYLYMWQKKIIINIFLKKFLEMKNCSWKLLKLIALGEFSSYSIFWLNSLTHHDVWNLLNFLYKCHNFQRQIFHHNRPEINSRNYLINNF